MRFVISAILLAQLFPASERDEYEEYNEEVDYYADNTATWTDTEQRLPGAIIIGVRKCGTRALLAFCGLHPNIVHADREVHFFDRYYSHGKEWYREQMPLSTMAQITMEKTPGYFIHPMAPMRIKAFDPKVKVIMVVRDPIERIVSDWIQVQEKRRSLNLPEWSLKTRLITRRGSINRRYRAVRTSQYYKHYQQWMKYFKKEQVLVIDGRELRLEPWVSVKKVEDFLELENKVNENDFYFNATRGFYCMSRGKNGIGEGKCLNQSKGRHHPPSALDPWLKQKLKRFYERYNRLFFRAIGRDLHWND